MLRRNFLKSTPLVATGVLASTTVDAAKKSKKKSNWQEKYSAIKNADVIVVGAGPAGVPAAISAARNGSKVILLEEDALPGGAPVDMFVSFPCGGPQNIGIFSEIKKKAKEQFDISGGKIHALWFFPSTWAFVLSEMIASEKNITFISGAPVCNVLKKGKRIAGVEYRNGEDKLCLARGKVVIDCTGNGILSELAGAETMFGRDVKTKFNEEYAIDKPDGKVQPCTMMAVVQRFKKVENCQIEKLLKNDFFKKRLVAHSGIGFAKNIDDETLKNVDQYLMWVGARPCDTRDNNALAAAQQKIINEFAPQIIKDLWKEGFTLHIAPKIGVRECRRVVGDKVITMMDIMSEKFPEDVISWGKYRIDTWGRKLPKEIAHKSLTFGIPFGATVVKDIDNLMMAGKHISGSSIAMSAYRVQPIVACMGEAVGLAASMASQKGVNPREINVKELQQNLVKRGILPKQYA
ncbi:MAG: FAD-dependent oxidoreductase [Verrucomicrobiaceae bacterium]|nr:FAD-dependent oxidoreductase [Verrucomicrobiaceae bacterium]